MRVVPPEARLRKIVEGGGIRNLDLPAALQRRQVGGVGGGWVHTPGGARRQKRETKTQMRSFSPAEKRRYFIRDPEISRLFIVEPAQHRFLWAELRHPCPLPP